MCGSQDDSLADPVVRTMACPLVSGRSHFIGTMRRSGEQRPDLRLGMGNTVSLEVGGFQLPVLQTSWEDVPVTKKGSISSCEDRSRGAWCVSEHLPDTHFAF